MGAKKKCICFTHTDGPSSTLWARGWSHGSPVGASVGVVGNDVGAAVEGVQRAAASPAASLSHVPLLHVTVPSAVNPDWQLGVHVVPCAVAKTHSAPTTPMELVTALVIEPAVQGLGPHLKPPTHAPLSHFICPDANS